MHGPVYRDIYLRYLDYKFDPIACNDELDDTTFSSSEKAILESVVKHICYYFEKDIDVEITKLKVKRKSIKNLIWEDTE